MEKIAEEDEKYSKLNLVEVAYGDDEPQKSTDQTQALLSKHPNLKVICAPTTIGIAAAGKVLQDTGSEVILGPPFRFDSSNIDEWKEIY